MNIQRLEWLIEAHRFRESLYLIVGNDAIYPTTIFMTESALVATWVVKDYQSVVIHAGHVTYRERDVMVRELENLMKEITLQMDLK